MPLTQTLRTFYRALRRSSTRLADASFRKGLPSGHDEMARGEFISAFITEQDLTFPRPAQAAKRLVPNQP